MVKVVKCEVYSRVVGYFRPVQNWNDGKRQEFDERVTFNEGKKVTDEVPTETSVDVAVC